MYVQELQQKEEEKGNLGMMSQDTNKEDKTTKK